MLAQHVDAQDGVVLAPLRVEDVTDTYVNWLNDPVVTRFTEVQPGNNTRDSVTAYVRQSLASADSAMWRVVVDGDVHVGNIRLSAIRWKHHRAEVALLIGSRTHWGKGIATRAIRSLSGYALGPMRLHKVVAGILIANVASRRAFEKAGYVLEARLRDQAFFEGAFCDSLLMSRLADTQG